MRASEINSFRNNRASKLRQLADILQRKGFVDDVSPLQSAANQCASPPAVRDGSRQEHWEYQVTNLIFKRIGQDSLAHVRPLGANDVTINLNVDLRGICRRDFTSDTPFVRLGVDIIARGKTKKGEEICSAWHLDKHPGGHTTAAHPEYHFQYGGRNMYNLKDYGFHMLLEVPRIAHPPLDGVLAIDFILSNYFGIEWQELRNDTEYKNLLGEAQQMFWVPYALCLHKICPANSPVSSWDTNSILPQLI